MLSTVILNKYTIYSVCHCQGKICRLNLKDNHFIEIIDIKERFTIKEGSSQKNRD